jgi:3-oxoacyl-[acyl-carrier protein] reductase
MDLKLTGKVALITGVGSQIGYGKGEALILAQEGCDIIAASRNFEGAKQTASEIEALGRKALAIKVDVRNREEVDDMVRKGIERFGKIDILVNNAGASSREKPFMEMTKEDWDLDIGVNLYGQMNVAQAVLRHMIARKSGRIINVSGGQGVANISVYGAAKGGVVQWSKALASEVAQYGIIVNVVSPGLGETGLTARAPRDWLERQRDSRPLKKFSTPEEVGRLIAFMASDICSIHSGTVYGA